MTFAELRELFDSPPRDFGPTPLWWWSGAPVTADRLDWQLERFAAGGIHNLVVINLAPAGPIAGARADDPAWFSERWWDRFAQACARAEELGMKIWFYDQIGFSGANLQGRITREHPEAAGRALRRRVTSVVDGHVELAGAEEVVAAYELDGHRIPVDPTGRIDRSDETTVQLVSSVATAFDYLNPDAVALLIDRIHSEFERRLPQYLGNVIAGSFQDELPATNSWTTAFAAQFLVRRGYDLLDELPALWQAAGTHAMKVRGDYYAVRAELTEEALFKPVGQWHTERGMLIGSDQSNPARAGNPTQATQIYTDYFRTHRWYSAAGSDHEGDAKVHSSLAHLYGHERVWIESFHSSGWGGTLEDTYDWLLPFLRRGANLYNPHASYFGTAGGWFEWAPPSTDWRQPYWQQYPTFSRAVARIASIMSWGEHSADVALLHPTATAQALLPLELAVDHFGDGQLGGQFAALDQTQSDYLALAGSDNWFRSAPGLLDRAGLGFDVIDDASVQRATVSEGALGVAGETYGSVILASTSVLEQDTAGRLVDLLEGGGKVVVVGRTPELAAGRHGDDAVVAALAAHPRLTRVRTPAEAVVAIADPGYATADPTLLVRRCGDVAVALVTGAFPNASRYPLRTGERRLWTDYDFDPARYAAAVEVRVQAAVAEAELWDPVSGATRPAAVTVVGSTSTIIADLDGAPAALLVWREGRREPTPAPTVPGAQTHLDVSAGWTGELVGVLDNTWGDLALPAGAPVSDLQLWSLDWAEGPVDGETSAWEPVKVTNGQRVAVLGAVPVDEAPPALDAGRVAAVLAGTEPLACRPAPGSVSGWTTACHSTSRGREKDGGQLGNKGMVPEEFVRVPAPATAEVSVLRAVVQLDRMGDADLVVGVGAARRVWWDGIEQPTGTGYLTTSRIRVDQRRHVLEIHLGPSENVPGLSLEPGDPELGCFFAVVPPGGFGPRPQFMTAGGVRVDGQVSYRHGVSVPGAVASASLVAGAATGLSILVDGQLVARQEKVEYYESSWGAMPMFFSHDVTARLGPGEHQLELIADSTDDRDVVLLDLVVQTEAGVVTVVSGSGWSTSAGGREAVSVEQRGHWTELASVHAAERTHPLPQTGWLHGPPVVGTTSDQLRTTDAVVPAAQHFRVVLPAGTSRFTLPVSGRADAYVDGEPVAVLAGAVELPAPLDRPGVLSVTTDPVVFDRGGAAWTGPLVVGTVQAPIELGDWQRIGLRAWSGGVRYRRVIEVPTHATRAVLDLGRVRGSLDAAVDGVPVATTFCAPYRLDLGDARGALEVEITVYNTLAPFFDESTPTTWVFPSQLESGLFGPVTLRLDEPRP